MMRETVMRIGREEKGTVTVYLAVIFMAMILFTGMFVDLARIRLAQNQLRRITNSAARSVMANYDTFLKNHYGLFALKVDRGIQEEFQEYIRANLESYSEKEFKLLGCQYESSALVLSQPVDDLITLKNQVMEDMKYSAPIDISRELINKFKAIGSLTGFFGEQSKKQKIIKSANAKISDIGEINNRIKDKKNELRQDKLLLKSTNEEINSLSRSGEPEAAAQIRDLQEKKSEIIRRAERDKREITNEINAANNKRLEIQQEIDELASWHQARQNNIVKPLDTAIQNNLENFKKENLDVLAADLTEIGVGTDQAAAALNGISANDEVISEDLFGKIELDPDNRNYNKYNSFTLSGYRDLLQTLTVSRNAYMTGFAGDKLLRYSKEAEEQVTDIVDYRSLGETDRKLETQQQKLNQISDLLSLDKKLEDMRNELYLNEYLLTHCSFITGEPKGNSDYDKKNTESEYVLYGSNAMEKAISELYITRFALDTMGYLVFSKPPAPPELLSRTIYSLIMGAIQASVDTYKLLVDSNNSVNIIEMMPNNPMQELNLTLTYKDHLRLFMLLHSDEEGKLKRLMEVIRQREGIETDKAFTLSKGRAEVSIKLWFLPVIGLNNTQKGPFQTKIRNGRCYITKNVEYGY